MKRKILYALLSVVISISLWLYVVNVISPETEMTFYNVPVVLDKEKDFNDNGLMLVSDSKPTLTLRLMGNRSDLNKLKSSDITVIADLTKISKAGEQQRLDYRIESFGSIPSSAVTVLSGEPGWITVDVVEYSTKTVPVVVDWVGERLPNYFVDEENRVLSFESVRLTGPKEDLEKVEMARITPSRAVDQNIDRVFKFTLCDANRNPVDASRIRVPEDKYEGVRLTVTVRQMKTLRVWLNRTYAGGATEQNTVITYDPMTITVSGPKVWLDSLGDTLYLDDGKFLDLSEVEDGWTKTYPIKLDDDLEGVTIHTAQTEVTVTVHFTDLVTKTLKVTNFEVTNVPAGVQYRLTSQSQEVVLRGPSEQIQAIRPEDVKIIVDLSGASANDTSYIAKVTVVILDDSRFGGIGVMDSYTIIVNLTTLQAEATGWNRW